MAGSRRRWGWHQLTPAWAERIVETAALPPGALVLDVGAGRGALTRPLLDAGARVVAVEAHPGRAAELRRRFGHHVVVVQADARDLRLPRRAFHVVSSPPYHLTSDLLRRLLAGGSRMVSARLVLQDQAARRWAGPAAPGLARWAATHRVQLGTRVPSSAFRPPPQVPNRVLEIERW